MINLEALLSQAVEKGGDAPISFLTPAEYEYLESRGLLPPNAKRIEYVQRCIAEV